jgi:hypothetical protein
MRYMMLIYTTHRPASPDEMAEVAAAHRALMDETERLGILYSANPLEPSATATTVRTHQGKVLVTDGPFAETKEQLAGYYMLECRDLDEAVEWAARIPTSCGGGQGSVEIRAIHEAGRDVPSASANRRARA